MTEKRKSIIFFSDLEGTLISEHGEFDEENFYKLLVELSNLANTLKADVNLALVSPVGPTYMMQIMKQMDDRIRQLHRYRGKEEYSVDLKSAAADFKDPSFDISERIDRRIDVLNTISGNRSTLGSDAKSNYVKGYVETKEASEENNTILYIYAGNGDNDVSAMNIINKLKNGLTICPDNTTYQAKVAARIRSNLRGVQGVGDCIKKIREKIQQRIVGTQSEVPKTEEQK